MLLVENRKKSPKTFLPMFLPKKPFVNRRHRFAGIMQPYPKEFNKAWLGQTGKEEIKLKLSVSLARSQKNVCTFSFFKKKLLEP